MSALAGRVAIVTGARRGIGAAVVRRLHADGARVVVHHRAGGPEADRLIAELHRDDQPVVAVAGDLRDEATIEALFAAAEALGGVHVLVNNAAEVRFAPLTDISREDVEASMGVNFLAALRLVQEAARRMGDGGRIVNISTLGTSSPVAGQTIYAASKAALEQLTLQGAVELAERGICINTVCPGATETETFREASPPGLAEIVAESSLFRRIGRPGDVADVVAFLATEPARWITGQRLVVSGGAR